MFEHVNYFYSFNSTATIVYYLFYINLGFILLWSIGSLAAKSIRISTYPIIKIFIGYTIYTTMAWYLFKTGYSALILPALFTLATASLLDSLISFLRNQKHLGKRLFPIRKYWLKIKPLVIIESILLAYWSGFLHKNMHHILIQGNNDLFFWGVMSDHLMGISNVSRINFGLGDHTFLDMFIDCFGVYSWFGLIGRISQSSLTIEASMLFQLSLLTLISWSIYEISYTITGLTRNAAFIPALLFSFNPLWVYIFTNNFLSQIIATFFLFCCLLITGSSINYISKKQSYVFFGFIMYTGILLSYPGLIAPYFAFILVVIGTFWFCLSRFTNQKISRIKTLNNFLLFLSGVIIGGLGFYDISLHAFNRFFQLSTISAGWPLFMLDPLNLIGLFSFSLDHTSISNWQTYLSLSLIISSALCIRIFIRNKTNIYDAKTNALLLLSIIALIAYCGVFYIKGYSYQQWKFCAYFTFPFTLLACNTILAPKRHCNNVQITKYIYYPFFLLIILFCANHFIKYSPLQTPKNDLYTVQQINTEKYKSMTLALEQPRDIMLAVNLLKSIHLYSIYESYFKTIAYKPERITPENPLLTTTDSPLAPYAINFINLTKRLILIKGIKTDAGTINMFNMSSLSGAYDRESEGSSWWCWVKHKITVTIEPLTLVDYGTRTMLYFEYVTPKKQTLTLHVINRNGTSHKFLLSCHDNESGIFDHVIDISPVELGKITIETDGKPFLLGHGDNREAALMIRNLRITQNAH